MIFGCLFQLKLLYKKKGAPKHPDRQFCECPHSSISLGAATGLGAGFETALGAALGAGAAGAGAGAGVSEIKLVNLPIFLTCIFNYLSGNKFNKLT